jgi:hypothetical protein
MTMPSQVLDRSQHDNQSSQSLSYNSFLHVGLCIRTSRRLKLTFPKGVEHQSGKVWGSASSIFRGIFHRSTDVLGLDCPPLWIQMGLYLRALRVWCWCVNVLAIWGQEIVRIPPFFCSKSLMLHLLSDLVDFVVACSSSAVVSLPLRQQQIHLSLPAGLHDTPNFDSHSP